MIRRRSRGAVLLARQGLCQAEIARRCGVTRAAVGHWLTGHAVPKDAHRAILRDAYGIPVGAWVEEDRDVAPPFANPISAT